MIKMVRERSPFLTDEKLARLLTLAEGREISPSYLKQVRRKLGIIKQRGRGVCRVVPPPKPKRVRKKKEAV